MFCAAKPSICGSNQEEVPAPELITCFVQQYSLPESISSFHPVQKAPTKSERLTTLLSVQGLLDELCLLSDAQTLAPCRAVALADPSKICAARIEACYASVHVSSNGLLLAVCEASRIRTWAIRDLLGGDQENHLCEWMLGNGETVKQASYHRPASQPPTLSISTFLGTISRSCTVYNETQLCNFFAVCSSHGGQASLQQSQQRQLWSQTQGASSMLCWAVSLQATGRGTWGLSPALLGHQMASCWPSPQTTGSLWPQQTAVATSGPLQSFRYTPDNICDCALCCS